MKPAGKSAAIRTGSGPLRRRDTTTYAIEDGRGFAQAARMLGADYAGVLQRDGWAPVPPIHPRRASDVSRASAPSLSHDDAGPSASSVCPAGRQRCCAPPWPRAIAIAAGTVSDHGLAVARGAYVNRLGRLLARRPSRLADARRFATHLTAEFDAVFSFLFDPTLDATNWRAEHALRPAVVTRKMCGGGNRTLRGAQTQQVLASVLRTAQQRGLDTTETLTRLLQAPRPIVLDAFQSAPLH